MDSGCLNLNVLAVDDEPGIRALYSRALNRKEKTPGGSAGSNFPQFKLHLASSGPEAVELVQTLRTQGVQIAAAFFDVRMPGGMDGIEAIRRIRAIDPQVLCTVVTAYGEDRLQEINEIFAPHHLDEWDYLNKPFNVGEIMQKARNTVSSWNRRRAQELQLEEIRRMNLELGDLNRTLDNKVFEPTAALAVANADLESVLKQLRQTEAQLVHNAKMASLGQLAAGIAHEINNPVGFIQSNLATGLRYSERLGDYIHQLENMIADNCDLGDRVERLKRTSKIEFILSDFASILNDSQAGTLRVQQIVSDLKTFSQLDQDSMGLTDLNETLKSTLSLISGEIKPGTNLKTDFGSLPLVPGDPSALAQVFMNILLNAADATPDQGEISVVTRRSGDRAE